MSANELIELPQTIGCKISQCVKGDYNWMETFEIGEQ